MPTFSLTPGNAVSCYINTHRSAWDGAICDNPAEWNCAATAEFRRDYCARGTPRCYHIHTFDGPEPFFLMDDYGAGWILGPAPHILDDQVMLILAREGIEPRGIREEFRRRYKVAGAYRIQEVRRIEQGHRVLWEVHPHADGWTRFHQFTVDSPRFEHAGGPYIKQIDRELVLRVFDEAAEAAQRPDPDWIEPADSQQFDSFHAKLPEWLDEAARAAARAPRSASFRALSARSVRAIGEEGRGPLADLPNVDLPSSRWPETKDNLDASVVEDLDGDPLFDRAPLLEPGRVDWICESYGEAACKAIQVASLTKELLILCGSPGVGKSYLAVRLLDDSERQRTLVVPVSATWRGSSDLFAHTPFVDFLSRAAEAYRSGDARARVVVFEEFNLSQPEYWMSDVLVASQFSQERERYVQIGGDSETGQRATRVFLSPAVRFVATLNHDHTVHPLSPRILDRAALVDLRREPRQSLACAGLRILEDMTMAIADLDFLIRSKGAGFSMRAALSLRACLEELESLGLEEWDAVDMVLVQEVLSKVQLVSRDPLDEGVLMDLKRWQDRHGNHLSRCSSMISEWEEKLRSGVDVVQA